MSVEHSYRVNAIKPLSREEEMQTWKQYEAGSLEARDTLLKSHHPYIISQAIKRINRGVPLEDLIQEGMMGFLHGMRKFDPSTGNRLMTYCSFWVDVYIRRYIENHRTSVRIPIGAQKEGRGYAADFSLDQTIEGDQTTHLALLGDEFIDTAELIGSHEDVQLVQRAVKKTLFRPKIKKVAQSIVDMRILADEPCTLQEVADVHGLSKERIRQIEVEARAAIRRSILRLAA